MKNDIQQELIALVNASLAHSGLAADYKDDIFLELPTDKRFGDFTTNIALKLSKELKQPPRVIASQLVESIRKEIKNNADLKDLITQVKVEGAGFVNFYLQENYFYEKLRRIITQGKEALKIDLGKGKK
ncbi:MAG: hypothetical protein KJ594_02295, partial [Candidatus Omnitrophica bacterium]|nr:hypothetical protein [Candidatus Omnitrophota bacterium]